MDTDIRVQYMYRMMDRQDISCNRSFVLFSYISRKSAVLSSANMYSIVVKKVSAEFQLSRDEGRCTTATAAAL